MEGVTAALILLGVLLFVIESSSIVAPQTVKVIDMKLGQMGDDALMAVDWTEDNSWSNNGSLKDYVAAWDGTAVNFTHNSPKSGMVKLNQTLQGMFPDKVRYNMELVYWDKNKVRNNSTVFINGEPHGDNSTMVATKLVTLNPGDADLSPYWRNSSKFELPQVVEVRLICWYL